MSEGQTARQTFVFADLAGFTALTEAHGDDAAAQIAQRFASQVRDLLPDHGAEEIKTIGDEVMIRCTDCEGAVSLGVRIVDKLAEHRSPPVRVGMHSGSAVEVNGDWFGGTVNLASRVSGAARPGEVLLTEETVSGLPEDSAIEIQARGKRYFKHIPQRVAVYRAICDGGGPDFAIDPVCRMAVDPSQAAESHRHAGSQYWFCSDHCAGAFAGDPKRFIARSPAARAARAQFVGHLRVFVVAQLIFFIAWAIDWARGGSPAPWFLLVLVPWGLGLGLHYRAVRKAL